MDLNPIEWLAWIYGKVFQNHAYVGGIVVVGLFAALGLVLWMRAIDKYKDEHGPKPQAVVNNSTSSTTATQTIQSPPTQQSAPSKPQQTKKKNTTQRPPDSVVNAYGNQQDITIDKAKVKAGMPFLGAEGDKTKVHVGELEYEQHDPNKKQPSASTPSQEPKPDSPPNQPPATSPQSQIGCNEIAAIRVCGNIQGLVIKDAHINSPGSSAITIDGESTTGHLSFEANVMPEEAGNYYKAGFWLGVYCSSSSNPEETRRQLVAWERAVTLYWKGENLKKWNEKFGTVDPEGKPLTQLCADLDREGEMLSFFRRVYYGFAHYSDDPALPQNMKDAIQQPSQQ